MRYHGKEQGDFIEPGHNSRITSSQAALLNWQLEKLDSIVKIRNEKAELYYSLLSEVKEISFPKFENQKSNYHKFAIYAQNRNGLKKYLEEKKVQTNIHYDKLLYEYGLMKNRAFKSEDIINAHKVKTEELTLPLYPELNSEEIHYVCKTIKEFYK